MLGLQAPEALEWKAGWALGVSLAEALQDCFLFPRCSCSAKASCSSASSCTVPTSRAASPPSRSALGSPALPQVSFPA
jgi:hypothetical protein